MDGQKEGRIDGRKEQRKDGWMEGRKERRMDGWMDRWIKEGRMDG